MGQATDYYDHALYDDATMGEQADYDKILANNGCTFHWYQLGQDQGSDAARLYSFCRLLDDLADGDLPDGKARLDAIYHDLTILKKAHQLSFGDFAKIYPFLCEINRFMLCDRIDGLLFDQGKVALQTSKIGKLCLCVAGTVGLMMCPLLGCCDKTAQKFAIDMGIAMQLTNIARDVLEDANMGRYLPTTWTEGLTAKAIASGAEQEDRFIIAPSKATAVTLALAIIIMKVVLLFAHLPMRPRLAIGIAAYSYRQIGVKLRANKLNWHHGRTVTSTTSKAIQSLRALPLGKTHPTKGASITFAYPLQERIDDQHIDITGSGCRIILCLLCKPAN